MNVILNTMSAAAAFLFGVGVLYILLDSTIGRLKMLHSKFEYRGLQVKDITFLGVASLAIWSLTSFVQPY